MRLYIAGPMTNLPFFNFPAFDDAACLLVSMGIVAWSPAEHDREEGLNEQHYPTGDVVELNERMPGHMTKMMRWDLDRIVSRSEGILRLPGWENSQGCALEMAVNKAVGGRVFDVVLRDGHMIGLVEVFDV